MDERLFYLGFSVFPGIGPAKFQLLLETFGKAETAWKAPVEDIKKVLGEKLANEFVTSREKFVLEDYEEKLESKNIGFVTLLDEVFPTLLKDIRRPPFVILYKGNKELLREKKTIAIVGTRMISHYGQEVTHMLASQLVDEQFVIVSGLALGVDGVAHQTALEKHGKTIAVLGSGVDICTPVEHYGLYNGILQSNGLIVSTVPPGEKPNRGSFPARNKIIAGLSLGTIVTEGAADSGALYTADFAKKMGRPVFAVPGPITSKLSAATSKLMKEGATVITTARDIVDTLGIITKVKTQSIRQAQDKNAKFKSLGDSPEEQGILDLLQIESLHFNEIVRKIGKDSKATGSLLSLMELKGLIRSSGEVYFL